jgi:hypothetical protein
MKGGFPLICPGCTAIWTNEELIRIAGNYWFHKIYLPFLESSRTKVVNVKVNEIRPEYQNLKDWCEKLGNVYIGRPGVVFVDKRRYPPADMCDFANPFKIGPGGSRDEVIEQFREYALERMKRDLVFRRKVFGLRGKNLGCWCAPEPCHGDVLVELAKMSDIDF